MNDNFDEALALVLAHEGGFVDHPKDPGGVTNLGVTKAAWEAFTGAPATVEHMRDLTPALVRPIYRKRYWEAAHCDELQRGLDYAVFDCAVNSGPGRAVKLLQQALGVPTDGVLGKATLAAIQAVPAPGLIHDMCEARLKFLRGLTTFDTFGKGWTRRVEEVRTRSILMSQETQDA